MKGDNNVLTGNKTQEEYHKALTRDEGGPVNGVRQSHDTERHEHCDVEVVKHHPRDGANRMIKTVADFQLDDGPVIPCVHDEHSSICGVENGRHV